MGLEVASYVSDLVTTNPDGGDSKSAGDNHLRLIKTAIKASFPNADHAIYLEQAQANIASATTTDIGAATSNYLNVTGTTTITGLGTAAAGIMRTLRFAAALTLTYNATSLILPGAASITTAANDRAHFVSLGSGNWLCLWYQTASGIPVVGAATMAALTDGDSWTAEATVASAGTCDILGAASNFILISGTSTITSLGTGTNKIKFVRFSGILTLTHNATTLILPDAKNITTAAGDTMLVISDGSSNCRVYFYTSIVGRQAIWIPAAAFVPRSTNGPSGPTGLEMTTNDNMIKTLDFDATTQEAAQFDIRMPPSWNEGTIAFVPVWSHPATATNFGVVWGLDAVAVSDDDAMDVAFGTEQTSTDTGGTTNDNYQGPESSAITVAGTPAAGDLVMLRIHRNPANGSDTMAVDARLHGIYLIIVCDQTKE